MQPLLGLPVGGTIRLDPPATAPTAFSQNVASAELNASKSASKQETSGTERVVEQELGREAFLQLLVLQLRNQDPLSPQDSQDMLAQLAQFSALEAQTNLNDSFETLSGNVDQLNFISASALLGRRVTGVDFNGDVRTGTVDGVQLDGSVVVLSVDGERMSMTGILQIDTPPEPEGEEGEEPGKNGV